MCQQSSARLRPWPEEWPPSRGRFPLRCTPGLFFVGVHDQHGCLTRLDGREAPEGLGESVDEVSAGSLWAALSERICDQLATFRGGARRKEVWERLLQRKSQPDVEVREIGVGDLAEIGPDPSRNDHGATSSLRTRVTRVSLDGRPGSNASKRQRAQGGLHDLLPTTARPRLRRG